MLQSLFQECQAPIIKSNVDVSNITSVAEQTTLLRPDNDLTSSSRAEPSIVTESEHSGLLRGDQTPPPGRAVIHTDSD